MVVLDAHRVADGVKRLGADHDRVEVEVVLVRVPPALVHPAEKPEQVERVDSANPGDAVLAVGGEGVVLRAQRASGTDLCCLLAQQAGPDAELTLPLQRGGFGVDPPDEDLVAVEAAEIVIGQLIDGGRVLRMADMVDALTLRGEQLDQLCSSIADGLGDRGRQRCHGSGVSHVLRHRDFVVAHRYSFSRNRRGDRQIALGHGRVWRGLRR